MDPTTRFSVSAHSTETHLLPHQVRHLAQVDQLCRERVRQGAGQCDVYIGHHVQPEGQAIAIFHGLALHIRVPSLLSEEEIEQNLIRRIQQRRRERTGNEWDPADDEPAPEAQHPPHDADRTNRREGEPEDASHSWPEMQHKGEERHRWHPRLRHQCHRHRHLSRRIFDAQSSSRWMAELFLHLCPGMTWKTNMQQWPDLEASMKDI